MFLVRLGRSFRAGKKWISFCVVQRSSALELDGIAVGDIAVLKYGSLKFVDVDLAVRARYPLAATDSEQARHAYLNRKAQQTSGDDRHPTFSARVLLDEFWRFHGQQWGDKITGKHLSARCYFHSTFNFLYLHVFADCSQEILCAAVDTLYSCHLDDSCVISMVELSVICIATAIA